MLPASGKPIALIDCNNFYVSCERLFDTSLHGIPVIVLSNNDGCAVARSEEAQGHLGGPFAGGVAASPSYSSIRGSGSQSRSSKPRSI